MWKMVTKMEMLRGGHYLVKCCHFFMLQDLNFNFQTVILPEAVTAFQAEEPSVLKIVKDLEALLSWVGIPMDSIIETLEQLVVNATTLGGVAFTLSVSHLYTDINLI